MTWGIFMSAMEEAELESGTQAQVLCNLFARAGSKREFTEQTAQSWIDEKRHCQPSRYFSDKTITNPNGAYNFFRRRPESKLKNLQQIFRQKKDVDSPIDCETEDMDRFCWSLVNQFLDLLGFQRLELPGADISQENSGGVAEDEIDGNADVGQNPEQVSFGGTPTEQMRGIFEKAVMDYKIANYICNLSDYLNGEAFYGGDIFAFNDAIENNILSRFLCEQNEKIYKMISEFREALKNYSGFMGMIRFSISEKYGFMWELNKSHDEIISFIDNECNEIKGNLEKRVSIKKEAINKSSVSNPEEDLAQLTFIGSIIQSHKQMIELFGEICPGKSLLVF